MPSSVIAGFSHDPDREELTIRFVNGRRYLYHGVPAAVAQALSAAESPGRFFGCAIRDVYPAEKLR